MSCTHRLSFNVWWSCQPQIMFFCPSYIVTILKYEFSTLQQCYRAPRLLRGGSEINKSTGQSALHSFAWENFQRRIGRMIKLVFRSSTDLKRFLRSGNLIFYTSYVWREFLYVVCMPRIFTRRMSGEKWHDLKKKKIADQCPQWTRRVCTGLGWIYLQIFANGKYIVANTSDVAWCEISIYVKSRLL